MTREMIHRLGVEAGLLMEGQDFGFRFDEVAKFAALVAAAERDAAVKDAERYRWIRDYRKGTALVVDELQDVAPCDWDAAIDAAKEGA